MDQQMVSEVLHKCEGASGLWKPFCEGGHVMFIIAGIGVLTLFLIIERMLTLKKLAINKDEFSENVFGMILRGDIQGAIAYCDRTPAPITNTIKAGLVQVLNRRPDEEVQVAMDASILRETPKLEGWTAFWLCLEISVCLWAFWEPLLD